jgi:hypothetical protein
MPINADGGLDQPLGALAVRLDALIEEGTDLWERFDREVRTNHWHPFVASDYGRALQALMDAHAAGRTFLEWGSATGVITILADLLGFEASGIELDAELVAVARDLASRHGSRARFAVGSFVPAGYQPKFRHGDDRLGTIGDGPSGYRELGHPLEDFDVVYAYPWMGEERVLLDLFNRYGGKHALLLLHGENGITTHRHGRVVRSA